jgi:hypothetical protein
MLTGAGQQNDQGSAPRFFHEASEGAKEHLPTF